MQPVVFMKRPLTSIGDGSNRFVFICDICERHVWSQGEAAESCISAHRGQCTQYQRALHHLRMLPIGLVIKDEGNFFANHFVSGLSEELICNLLRVVESRGFWQKVDDTDRFVQQERTVGKRPCGRYDFVGTAPVKRLPGFVDMVKGSMDLTIWAHADTALVNLATSGEFPNLNLCLPMPDVFLHPGNFGTNVVFKRNPQSSLRVLNPGGVDYSSAVGGHGPTSIEQSGYGFHRFQCDDICPQDKSLSLTLLFQRAGTPTCQQAYFCVNGYNYPIMRGLAVIFNGSDTRHGVFSSLVEDVPPVSWWYSVTFVRRYGF